MVAGELSVKEQKKESLKMLVAGKSDKEILEALPGLNPQIVNKQKGFLNGPLGIHTRNKMLTEAQALVGGVPNDHDVPPAIPPNTILNAGGPAETVLIEDTPRAGLPTGNGNGFTVNMPQQTLNSQGNGHVIPSQTTINPQDQAQFASITQQQLMLMADPIIRKVSMNPRFYLWYDYFRSKGMNGDPGDFINDLLEYFLNDQGYRIAIEKNERSVVR